MVELTPTERLQPCLLDRLTDEHPESTRESKDQRVVSMSLYRQAVLRDLSWLLNTSNRPEADEIYEYEDASKSVLNFGIRDFCGKTTSGLSPAELERQLILSVKMFEPRVMPESLAIKAVGTADGAEHNVVSFEIRGDLWAQPTPDQLYIKTEIDLETGHCKLLGRKNG